MKKLGIISGGCLAVALTGLLSFSAKANTSTKNHFYLQQDSLKFKVSEAPEWTALFNRKLGWFGADGIFAIPMSGKDLNSGGATMLVFSDTMLGEIRGEKLQPGFKMIHNSVAMMDKVEPSEKNIRFHWNNVQKDKPKSIFTPKTKNTKPGEYFWLGDGFVNKELNGATYIFAYRVRDEGTGAFAFAEVGNVLIKIPAGSKVPFTNHQQMDTPFFLSGKSGEEETTFGGSIYANTISAGAKNPDGYIYVYGVKGKDKKVVVARVKPKLFEQFDAWRFWDGKDWNTDIKKTAGIADKTSNELSVSELPDGRYAMVFQVNGWGNTIGMRIGSSPVGPFGETINIWDCKDAVLNKNFFVYNAKAHPALSKPGELLISYNVNSFDFWNDIKQYPNLYRPRFIKVSLTD